MPSNAEAAELLRNIGDLLDVLGEKFKPEAYRRASRSIDSMTEDLSQVAARNELDSIPGVGEAIAEKLGEYLRTGHSSYYERIQKEIPPGIVEIMRLPGLGPKTARRFWVELQIQGPKELSDAIDSGRLASVAGFGPRKIELIKEALAAAQLAPAGSARMPIDVAYPIAIRIARALRERSKADQVEIAGSFRRGRETVGDLDFLVTSQEPEKVFDLFSALPEIREVRMRGPTKETVVLTNGLQVDLRVVEPDAFGAALLYFTGSKDHNVHLRTIARDRGLKINEYGIFRGDDRIGGRTEEEMYDALKLAWIPPEIRENRGEIEQAAKGPIPPLVSPSDLTGDLHVHLAPDASEADVERVLSEARNRKYETVGIVAAGLDDKGRPWSLPSALSRHLAIASTGKPRVLRGVEVRLGIEAPKDSGSGWDYAIDIPREGASSKDGKSKAGPAGRLLAHLSGLREPSGAPARAWIALAKGRGEAIEVGPGPDRLDSVWARAAIEGGVALSIATGLGDAADDPTLPVALGFARRAGARVANVQNAGALAGEPRRQVRSARRSA
jgi:DNA polymerase (family X)